MHKLIRSVGHGISGFVHVVLTEANMRWHLLAAAAVVAAGIFFQISEFEWISVTGCIAIVIGLECLNTALERLADRVTQEVDPLIGRAKDAGAAAVLVASAMAAIIGGIIFIPKLSAWIGGGS